jgi:hypothetical protein
MRSGRIDDLVIGGDHGAIGSIPAHQPLNHLIGFLPAFGIDDFYPAPKLSLLGRQTLSPPIEHNRNRVILPMTIRRKIAQEPIAGGVKSAGKRAHGAQEIVTIDNDMRCHAPTLA